MAKLKPKGTLKQGFREFKTNMTKYTVLQVKIR